MDGSAKPFGALVLAARQERRLSQDELAERVGVGRTQISRIEKGRKGPSYGALVAIARELDLDLNLLKEIEQPEQAA